MKDRISLLIKAKNLTAAQFADEIGVQKSSISHIISGRNNASLDFIQKVLLCYPEVNMEWLMFGKGPLFEGHEIASNVNNDKVLNNITTAVSANVDLFSGLTPAQAAEYRKENDLNPEQVQSEISKSVDIQNEASFPLKDRNENNESKAEDMPGIKMPVTGQKNGPAKTILKIVEFYSDNTYREYFPG